MKFWMIAFLLYMNKGLEVSADDYSIERRPYGIRMCRELCQSLYGCVPCRFNPAKLICHTGDLETDEDDFLKEVILDKKKRDTRLCHRNAGSLFIKNKENMAIWVKYGHRKESEILTPMTAKLSGKANRDCDLLYIMCDNNNPKKASKYLKSLGTANENRVGMRANPTVLFRFVMKSHQQGCQMVSPTDTLLHKATRLGFIDVVKCVLAVGNIDVNHNSPKLVTPVVEAASKGFSGIFKILVQYGARLDISPNFNIGLFYSACKGGNMYIIKSILDRNPNLDLYARSKNGITAPIAATRGGVHVVKFLLNMCANLHTIDNSGNTILQSACRYGELEVLKFLLHRCLYENRRIEISIGQEHAGENGCNISAISLRGNNLLHIASMFGHANIVKFILAKNLVNINSKSSSGKTAILIAGTKGKVSTFEFLLKSGCNLTIVDNEGNNVLHEAYRGSNDRIVSTLRVLGHAKQLNVTNKAGQFPHSLIKTKTIRTRG